MDYELDIVKSAVRCGMSHIGGIRLTKIRIRYFVELSGKPNIS